jgi:hypothetical protein
MTKLEELKAARDAAWCDARDTAEDARIAWEDHEAAEDAYQEELKKRKEP